MVNSSIVKLIRERVNEIKENFNYPNEGHAFVHFAIKTEFDFEDEETSDYCSIGLTGHDYGIDAIFEKDDTLYLVQGKYTKKNNKGFNRNELNDLESALNFLKSSNYGIKRQELLKAATLYRDYLENGGKIKLLIYLFGYLTDDGKKYIESFRQSLPDNHEIEVITLDRLTDTFIQYEGIYSNKGPDVVLKIKEYMIRDPPGFPKSIVCTVAADEIARIVNKHRKDVFQLNVREYLRKTPVNKEIENTIKSSNPYERKMFWYYNLGLTAICDEFHIKNGFLVCKNFRIINGCQTATILSENTHSIAEIDVLLRVIETTDKDVANKITLRNNKQNPIRGRDLFSQETEQIRIQNYFSKRNPPVFYERRAGEWRSMPGNVKRKFRDNTTRKYRLIDNETCAKAYMSFKLQKPAEAKMKKKLIFVSKYDGGYYEDIFNDKLDYEELLLAHYIYTKIKEKIRGFIRYYNSLPDDKRRDEDLALLRSFLPHADTQLTAMFGEVIKRKFKNGYNARDLYEFLNKNPHVFDEMYDKLVNILKLTILTAKGSQGETFNVRNYLVNNNTFNIIRRTLDLHFDSLQPTLKRIVL